MLRFSNDNRWSWFTFSWFKNMEIWYDYGRLLVWKVRRQNSKSVLYIYKTSIFNFIYI